MRCRQQIYPPSLVRATHTPLCLTEASARVMGRLAEPGGELFPHDQPQPKKPGQEPLWEELGPEECWPQSGQFEGWGMDAQKSGMEMTAQMSVSLGRHSCRTMRWLHGKT